MSGFMGICGSRRPLDVSEGPDAQATVCHEPCGHGGMWCKDQYGKTWHSPDASKRYYRQAKAKAKARTEAAKAKKRDKSRKDEQCAVKRWISADEKARPAPFDFNRYDPSDDGDCT